MNRYLTPRRLIFGFAFCLLLAAFGCDGDSSSGPGGDGSAATDLSSSDGISSSNETQQKPLSSSSSTKIDGSSSSVKGAGSSSSSKVSSSSTARSSSSSAPRSSSSWVLPLNYEITYDSLIDDRDGQKYYTLRVTDKFTDASITVMAQNLNYGTMVSGDSEQSNNAVVEKYCYGDDPENCNRYGGLYQWAEMMALDNSCNTTSCAHLVADTSNHQGICPDGWRVMTHNDFDIVINSSGDGVRGVRSGLFGGLNTSGYTLMGSGGRSPTKGFEGLRTLAIWFFPNEHGTTYKETRAYGYGINSSSNTLVAYESSLENKTYGGALRCVKAE
ncbi:MAG: hypothetical protein LBR60_06880 [Fibrobacter sp.]|jgi:uncharacterized protein (TIGR02145 family)|nr:hypothetical protein [Fibrobacter sp.]